MYTVENGKIVNGSGVSVSLDDVLSQLNKLEVLTGELTEELAGIPHPSPKYDNYFDSFVTNHRLTTQEEEGDAQNCIECGEDMVDEGYNNWQTCKSCLEYDVQSQVDYESEYSSNWQSYSESTSYGRGNW